MPKYSLAAVLVLAALVAAPPGVAPAAAPQPGRELVLVARRGGVPASWNPPPAPQ